MKVLHILWLYTDIVVHLYGNIHCLASIADEKGEKKRRRLACIAGRRHRISAVNRWAVDRSCQPLDRFSKY